MHQFSQPIPLRPEEIELLRSDVRGTLTKKQERRLEKLLPSRPDTTDAFVIKSAGDWLRYSDQQKPSEKLFGDFWFENELAIMYADTNAGKSILAVQLGEAIAGGYPIEGFEMPRQPQNVLYFDFELSAEQFSRRYTNYANGHYRFPNNFYRVVLNPNAKGEHKFKLFADYLENALENFLITTGARVIILDNLTSLRSGTEAAAGAIRLMRSLRNMRQRYGLSILVLAHTPKRKPGMPLTGNDLGGSKMLLNFADSAFAIGQSEVKPGLSYLIQIKQRNAARQYGPENVCLCRLVKPYNFIKFQFEGQGIESRHLLSLKQQQLRDTEIHLLALRNEGKSLREIAVATGIPHSTVALRLKNFMQAAATETPPTQPADTGPFIPAIAEPPPQVIEGHTFQKMAPDEPDKPEPETSAASLVLPAEPVQQPPDPQPENPLPGAAMPVQYEAGPLPIVTETEVPPPQAAAQPAQPNPAGKLCYHAPACRQNSAVKALLSTGNYEGPAALCPPEGGELDFLPTMQGASRESCGSGDTASVAPHQATVMPQPEYEQEANPAESPPGGCRSFFMEIPIVMKPKGLTPDANWRSPYGRRNRSNKQG